MKLLNTIGLSAFQLFSSFFVIGYFLGILNNYFSDKNNYCAMTYMYEYPQFVQISLENNKIIFPQYGLYAYSEGRFTERSRRMWFDGIPVLFLPGNSGSHMQVRSIASVALRKALSQEYDYHFDYFTISYNEELSGLYGGVLQSQTQFASACVLKILSLYKNNKYTKSVPTSVILIGHSMGGLIAKRLLAYPITINTTNIAITLAAPLEAPVVNFDPVMNDYYTLINSEWEKYINRHEEIKRRKFLIGIGSGPRDVLVPSGLTSCNDTHMSALATSIPGVWVTPDHVAMVWCKQLVLVVNRFLFDIVDPLSEQVTDDSLVLMTKAEQHFQANRSMILNPRIPRKNVTMQADAFWYEDNRRIYQISRPEIDRTTHLMIRLVSFPQNRFVAVESVNVHDKDWIFGCNAKNVYHSYRYCKEATSLSELSRWTGSVPEFGKRKLATVNLHKLVELQPDWTHVVVRVAPTKKPVTLNVDINDHASRQIDVKLPSDFSFGKHIVKAETEANSLYYELILSDLSAVHQAYSLYVEATSSCQATSYHVSAELHVPWAKLCSLICVTLNVDINDHASRQIDVKLPSDFSFGTHIVKAETEANSLYYELILSDLSVVHQAYLLYVEPTSSCQATSYHVSAELHVPWAKNHEYYHYFTHLKKSPMKLRLFKSNPNVTQGLEPTEKAKITLLLDPKCSFSISISSSWYYRLAQLSRNYTPVLMPYVAAIVLLAARSNLLHLKKHGTCVISSSWYYRLAQISRNYTPVLMPYVAAIVLLAARSNLLHLKKHGTCVSVHGALMSEGVKPYYALVFGRLGTMALMSIPFFSFLFENASWRNQELQYFTRSLLVLPAYMTALGILNIVAAAVLIVMVFSSQLAHRLLFRIVWRGGTGLAEKMAAGLQKVPMVVSAALVTAVPLSCGAASLAAGAAFYAFILSKMYEEYLEDYVYRLMSKVASKMCRMFKLKKVTSKDNPATDVKSTETTTSDVIKSSDNNKNEKNDNTLSGKNDKTDTSERSDKALVSEVPEEIKDKCDTDKTKIDVDEDLNNINFHLMLFFMWMIVTVVNIPALLTWARNFKYSMVLKLDTSYHSGLVMSACSAIIWQKNGPRRNLRHYEAVSMLLFTMAVIILALGPFSLSIVNIGVTFMFTIITVQQICDIEDTPQENITKEPDIEDTHQENITKEPVLNSDVETSGNTQSNDQEVKSDVSKENITPESQNEQNSENASNEGVNMEEGTSNECDVCNENRLYNVFRNLRQKFSFGDSVQS